MSDEGIAERRRDGAGEGLPDVLDGLSPRMREIATIVYAASGLSASEIQARIDDDITVYGVRTLLRRLVRRGILNSRPSGRHSEIVYLPATITPAMRERALDEVIETVFAGSSRDALIVAMRASAPPSR